MLIQTRLLFWCDAFTLNSRVIFIHPNHANELDLIKHEECHQAQIRAYGWFKFMFNYFFNSDFRLRMEVEAHKVQINNGGNVSTCVYNLCNNYRIKLSFYEAFNLLTKD